MLTCLHSFGYAYASCVDVLYVIQKWLNYFLLCLVLCFCERERDLDLAICDLL